VSDERALLDALAADLADTRAYAVLGDFWQTRGDARGDLIALSLATPSEPRWRELCALARATLEVSGPGPWWQAFVRQLDRWPDELRVPPTEWFTTPQSHFRELMGLGCITAAKLASWNLSRSGDPETEQTFEWTLFTEPEITVLGSKDAPDPAALQTARYVLGHWQRLEKLALDALVERFGGPLSKRHPGEPRYEASFVTVGSTPSRIRVWYIDDEYWIDCGAQHTCPIIEWDTVVDVLLFKDYDVD
jgi:hypothetical protein